MTNWATPHSGNDRGLLASRSFGVCREQCVPQTQPPKDHGVVGLWLSGPTLGFSLGRKRYEEVICDKRRGKVPGKRAPFPRLGKNHATRGPLAWSHLRWKWLVESHDCLEISGGILDLWFSERERMQQVHDLLTIWPFLLKTFPFHRPLGITCGRFARRRLHGQVQYNRRHQGRSACKVLLASLRDKLWIW